MKIRKSKHQIRAVREKRKRMDLRAVNSLRRAQGVRKPGRKIRSDAQTKSQKLGRCLLSRLSFVRVSIFCTLDGLQMWVSGD